MTDGPPRRSPDAPGGRRCFRWTAPRGEIILTSTLLVGEVPRYRYPLDALITILATGGYLTALPTLLNAARCLALGRFTR